MDGAVAVPPLCYHRLTEEQHLLLIEKGKKLFESLQDRPSRLDVPSTLSLAASITRRQTTDSIPDVTPAQKERHALQQENKILRSRLENLELHVDSNLDPLSPSRSPISSRKNLRSLDKEGALHQENESLRRHVNQLTTSGKQNFEKIQTLEKTNQHLEAKLQLYRRELQRKEEEEQQHSLVTTTTVPLVGAAPLSRQHEIDRTENIRLRRLLAERNELTLSLKDDLERMVKERVRYYKRRRGRRRRNNIDIFWTVSLLLFILTILQCVVSSWFYTDTCSFFFFFISSFFSVPITSPQGVFLKTISQLRSRLRIQAANDVERRGEQLSRGEIGGGGLVEKRSELNDVVSSADSGRHDDWEDELPKQRNTTNQEEETEDASEPSSFLSLWSEVLFG